MIEPVKLPVIYKRPRMYIGDGNCLDLHYITVGYLLNEDGHGHDGLLGAYYETVKAHYATIDAIDFDAKLRSRTSDNQLDEFIRLVTNFIDCHNRSVEG